MMTLAGKTWTLDTLGTELADLEKQKDADVAELTRLHRERRNEEVQDIRQLYRSQRKKLIAAIDVLLAEKMAKETPFDETATEEILED